MKVPEEVIKAAQGLIDMFGEHFKYLGRLDDADFYMFEFPDDSENGFPWVYQYKNGEVVGITGFSALDIIRLFIE